MALRCRFTLASVAGPLPGAAVSVSRNLPEAENLESVGF